jgi:type I restriction enzyme S subunit
MGTDFTTYAVLCPALTPSGGADMWVMAWWSVNPASMHLDVVRGFSYKGAGLSHDGIPMHNLNSVLEGGGYKYEGIKFYSLDYKEKHRVVPGDIIVANTEQGFDRLLIAFGAMIPKCYGEGIFSHHTYRIRPRIASPLSTYFIFHLFLPGRFQTSVAGYTNGTTVNMLPADGLSKPTFVCPPKDVIEQFSLTVEPMCDLVEENVQQSLTLAQLRDTLLPKLLSGEFTLPAAHAQTEEALS